MSVTITNDKYYSDIANAIRTVSGSSTTYTPDQMAAAITSLSGSLSVNSRIIVTASSGGEVTATNGSTTKIAVYKNGHYIIYNCTVGTWAVRLTKDGGYTESNVTIPSDNRKFEYNVAF